MQRACDLVVTQTGARYRGRVYPCAVGRGGIGVKRGEGDGITPVGTWRIAEVRYRADRIVAPAAAMPMAPIGPADIWSDDPADPNYNRERTARAYPFSHERMFRADPLYDLVAITDFNWPNAIAGAGSAIFLHAWRKPRHPTAGCVAFAPPVLRVILESWVPEARIVIR
jgi:L,D-peptidoglycan transpeptidase YkuD (ErfK/YbiS/YcfS/YnhG family)